MTEVLNIFKKYFVSYFKMKCSVCHDSHRRWLPCLLGRRSAVVAAGLLAATDPFVLFC